MTDFTHVAGSRKMEGEAEHRILAGSITPFRKGEFQNEAS